jgi:hypothetical protein
MMGFSEDLGIFILIKYKVLVIFPVGQLLCVLSSPNCAHRVFVFLY